MIIGVVVLVIVIVGVLTSSEQVDEQVARIGVITPLTGGAGYWAESSVLGVELAKRDLAAAGITVEFVIEDGALDPKMALSAAQKLVEVDKVDALYSEFNPAAIAVTSYAKNRDVLHLYDAASVSPLADDEYVYKTYIDYTTSCNRAATLAKNRGVERMGVLEIGQEIGVLCRDGVQQVFGTSTYVETYQVGDTDFRSQLTKLKSHDVQAVINVSFQPETLASLRQVRELDPDLLFLGVSDAVSPDIVDEYGDFLEGAIMFGLPAVSDEFRALVDTVGEVSDYSAAALAYIHTKQLAEVLHACADDLICARNKLGEAKPEPFAGFLGFTDRVAGFDVRIVEWKDGQFVDIK